MDFGVVHEEINGVIPMNLSSKVSEKWLKFFLGEWEISDLYVKETMALADSSADGLTRLLTCTILDGHIGSLIRPGILLVASGLEDTFINEH